MGDFILKDCCSEKNVQVLVTDDFLYYVIVGDAEVIKDKAIKKAEKLRKTLSNKGDVQK